jgi:hypothetical protein
MAHWTNSCYKVAGAYIFGVAFILEEAVFIYPIEVSLFGVVGAMLDADGVMHLIQELFGPAFRFLSSACCPKENRPPETKSDIYEYNFDEKLVIRNYEPHDLVDCRRLWIELTQWHRDSYDSASIGGDNPGIFFSQFF